MNLRLSHNKGKADRMTLATVRLSGTNQTATIKESVNTSRADREENVNSVQLSLTSHIKQQSGPEEHEECTESNNYFGK